MSSASNDPEALAKRMLASGSKVSEVQDALTREGLDRASASRIVEEVLTAQLTCSSGPAPAGSFSWRRVVLGMIAAVMGFVAVYFGFTVGLSGHFSTSVGAIRGGLIGGGGGLAIGGLNLVRAELMMLMSD